VTSRSFDIGQHPIKYHSIAPEAEKSSQSSWEEVMLDVFAYALFVIALIGLLRYVMRGIEPEGGRSDPKA